MIGRSRATGWRRWPGVRRTSQVVSQGRMGSRVLTTLFARLFLGVSVRVLEHPDVLRRHFDKLILANVLDAGIQGEIHRGHHAVVLVFA